MKVFRILLDMDEVLADFLGSAARLHGFRSWEDLLGVHEHDSGWCNGKLFWEKIHEAGEPFWYGLEPLPWARELTNLAILLTDENWFVATAPSRSLASHTGKIKWLKKFMGHRFDRYLVSRHKYLFAQPGVVLIDDREDTVDSFKLWGGESILFPTPYNRLAEYTSDPLAYVTPILKEMF